MSGAVTSRPWWRNWRYPAAGAAVVAVALGGVAVYGVQRAGHEREMLAQSVAAAAQARQDCLAAADARDAAASETALVVAEGERWALVLGYVERQDGWRPGVIGALFGSGEIPADAAEVGAAVDRYRGGLGDQCDGIGEPVAPGEGLVTSQEYADVMAANASIVDEGVVAVALVEATTVEFVAWREDVVAITDLETARIFAEAVEAYEVQLVALQDVALEARGLWNDTEGQVQAESTREELDAAIAARVRRADIPDAATAADVEAMTEQVVASQAAIQTAVAAVEESHGEWEAAQEAARRAAQQQQQAQYTEPEAPKSVCADNACAYPVLPEIDLPEIVIPWSPN